MAESCFTILSKDGLKVTIPASVVKEIECLNAIASKSERKEVKLPFNVNLSGFKNFFQWARVKNYNPDFTANVAQKKMETEKRINNILQSLCLDSAFYEIDSEIKSYLHKYRIDENHPEFMHLTWLILCEIDYNYQLQDLELDSGRCTEYWSKIRREFYYEITPINSLQDLLEHRPPSPLYDMYEREQSDRLKIAHERRRITKLLEQTQREIKDIRDEDRIVRITRIYEADLGALRLAHYFHEPDFYNNAKLNIQYKDIGKYELMDLPEEICNKIAQDYIVYIRKQEIDLKKLFNLFASVSKELGFLVWESNKEAVMEYFGVKEKQRKIMAKKDLEKAISYINNLY